MKKSAFLLITLLFSIPPGTDRRSSANPLPLSVSRSNPISFAGEVLEYDVYWSALKVGRIVIHDEGPTRIRDTDCHKVELFAGTAGAVEKLYKDRRKYVGYLKPNHSAWIFEEWEVKDNKWRIEEWLGFFPAEGLVRRYKRGEVRNTIEAPSGVIDPAGAIYYLRKQALELRDEYELTVAQGKHLYRATAKVGESATLETPVGAFSAVQVSPRLFYKGKRLGNRSMRVWFTQDRLRIPVLITADIEFGSFRADLVRYRPPDSYLEGTDREFTRSE